MSGLWKKILLGIGIFIALIIGIFLLVMQLTQPYVDLVETQQLALSQGDGAAAYSYLSLTAREEVSEADYIAMMERIGLWEDSGGFQFSSRNVENNVARLNGTYTRADGAVLPVSFVIVREQDELRITSFQFGS